MQRNQKKYGKSYSRTARFGVSSLWENVWNSPTANKIASVFWDSNVKKSEPEYKEADNNEQLDGMKEQENEIQRDSFDKIIPKSLDLVKSEKPDVVCQPKNHSEPVADEQEPDHEVPCILNDRINSNRDNSILIDSEVSKAEIESNESNATTVTVASSFSGLDSSLTPSKSDIVDNVTCINESEMNHLTTALDATHFDSRETDFDRLVSLSEPPRVVSFDEFVNGLLENGTISKLGEASFSEVFLYKSKGKENLVLKIIPFAEQLTEESCSINDVYQEARIAKDMSYVDGFMKVKRIAVVEGTYPEHMLELWTEYDEIHKSESYYPDFYEPSQMFFILITDFGGSDLEHFELTSWEDAYDIFRGTAIALKNGEQARQFEVN